MILTGPAEPAAGDSVAEREPLILAAGRCPFGARHGRLSDCHPVDLLAGVLAGVLARNGVDAAEVDEVLVGCATPVGAQAANLAGHVARATEGLAGVPAFTVNSLDTSSLLALVRAADAVRSGRCEVVLVGGVEVMSTVPAGADVTHRGFGRPRAPRPVTAPAPAAGEAAERWALAAGVSRELLTAAAELSRGRAGEAQANSRFDGEFVASGVGWATDELLGPPAAPPPAAAEGLFSAEGLLTAATVAPMADGASAVVVASVAAARRLGVEPVARVVAAALAGGDPAVGVGAAPEAATRVLAAGGLGPEQVQRVELAEPLATAVVRWQQACPQLAEVTNPDGGSLALGHPQGATGLSLVARLLRAFAGTPGGYGLAAADARDGHGVAVLLQA